MKTKAEGFGFQNLECRIQKNAFPDSETAGLVWGKSDLLGE